MKSDIDELMKGGRMTLGQMVGPGAKDNFYKTTDNKKYLLLIGVVLVLVSVGVWIITGSGEEESPDTRPSRLSVPAPLLATEVSRTITVKHQDRLQLFRLLEDSMRESELFGTTKRIVVKIQMPDGQERFATFTDFVDFYRLSPPKNLAQFLEGPLMIFIYYGQNGSRLGLATKTSDVDRTALSMFSWEPAVALDFRQLFFGAQFGEITEGFEDRTYRNIDWRFIKSARTENLGVGYTIFPARNILVITTSKEAMEKAIDRLFETK
ncbi:MAG: hypothetical protein Q8R29_00515 [bacterium]|nr:hypothetical protein [bacterium]